MKSQEISNILVTVLVFAMFGILGWLMFIADDAQIEKVFPKDAKCRDQGWDGYNRDFPDVYGRCYKEATHESGTGVSTEYSGWIKQ